MWTLRLLTWMTFFCFPLYSDMRKIADLKEQHDAYEKTESILRNYIEKNKIPGTSVALYYDEGEYFFSYGLSNKENKTLVDENTLFQIGSITKVFTATLLALKFQEGRVDLKDPITKYLPIKENQSLQNILLINLATHTSGLPRSLPGFKYGKNFKEQDLYDFLNQWKSENTTNSTYQYSNLGFKTLGLLLSKENKTSYFEMLKTYLLNPLEMKRTFLEVPKELTLKIATGYQKNGVAVSLHEPNTITPGSGALLSSSQDLLKFLKANLGVYGPDQIKIATEFATRDFFIINQNLRIGLGWQRYNSKDIVIIEKNGSLPGFSSYIGFIRGKKKSGIVILSNRQKEALTELGRKILLELQN